MSRDTQGLTKYSVVFWVNTFLTAHLLYALHSLRKVYQAGNKKTKKNQKKQKQNKKRMIVALYSFPKNDCLGG